MTDQNSSLRPFVLWALEQLGLTASCHEGVYHCALDETRRQRFGNRRELRFALEEDAGGGGTEQVERLSLESPLFDSLLEALHQDGDLLHAQPADQPQSVHELTGRLFPAYQVDGGNVRLGGCQLVDRPFLRLSYLRGDAAGPQLVHILVDQQGNAVADETIGQLGMDTLTAMPHPLPLLTPTVRQHMFDAAKQLAAQENLDNLQPAVATVLWCKYAQGRLIASIGEAEASFPFASWARTLEAPPLVCPHTGVETFHLALTDDQRIVAASEIAVCEASSLRVLRKELVRCAVTGKRVLPEYAARCPVSGEQVLSECLQPCARCQQPVSPHALSDGICQSCRQTAPVSKDDPRMARLLGEYPGLDRWRKWKLSETETSLICEARGLTRKFLIIVDKESLEPSLLATSGRWFGRWEQIEPANYEAFLRRADG